MTLSESQYLLGAVGIKLTVVVASLVVVCTVGINGTAGAVGIRSNRLTGLVAGSEDPADSVVRANLESS